MKCEYCGQESVGVFCSQEHEENSAVFDILENINDEMDLIYNATCHSWKVELTSKSYDTVKNRPGTYWVTKSQAFLPRNLVFEKDGHEYLMCWKNYNMPFIIHARIVNKDAEIDKLMMDDLNKPKV